MALFTTNNPKVFKFVALVIKFLIPFFLLIFIYVFFSFIYKGIATKNYNQFCYALFVANGITCNCLLGFGRSQVFISRSNEVEQKWIYFSACMFLTSAIIGFFLSGWIYVITDKDFFNSSFLVNNYIGHQIIMISLTIGLGISIILSIIGIVYFFKWINKATDDLNEQIKKRQA